MQNVSTGEVVAARRASLMEALCALQAGLDNVQQQLNEALAVAENELGLATASEPLCPIAAVDEQDSTATPPNDNEEGRDYETQESLRSDHSIVPVSSNDAIAVDITQDTEAAALPTVAADETPCEGLSAADSQHETATEQKTPAEQDPVSATSANVPEPLVTPEAPPSAEVVQEVVVPISEDSDAHPTPVAANLDINASPATDAVATTSESNEAIDTTPQAEIVIKTTEADTVTKERPGESNVISLKSQSRRVVQYAAASLAASLLLVLSLAMGSPEAVASMVGLAHVVFYH